MKRMKAAIQLGYCTNVHAGADLATTRANLERHALGVKSRFSPDRPMGVGLWLSAAAARNLIADGETASFGAWLREVGLVPFTLNGFPHGDFHQAVVKHRVYEPTWWEPARLDYTLDLIAIQHELLPAGMEGSISTLPIAWGTPRPRDERLQAAASQLARVALQLAKLEKETGRLITLCLEPEPGCVLQRSRDVVQFFSEYLLPQGERDVIRRYLRVCHDVCHAAVMFERQTDVLRAYHDAGIQVGKVQVSAAIRLPPGVDHRPATDQLAGFAEDRYLHQTVVRDAGGETFYEDLPLALQAGRDGEWRVHFHVPIYLESFGLLNATQQDIRECLDAVAEYSDVRHFEVETYAWGVLPPELRQPELAAGIAQEMQWFRDAAAAGPLTIG
jgi:hypothetical protein